MKIIEKADEMRKISAELKDSGKKTGFVPTMGFLHRGHTSLFEKAAEISDIIIASIYVNPTQFGPNEDFEHYPRDRERDIELSEKHGVDILFAPDNKQMYPAGHSTTINVTRVSEPFEGEKRPGHFNGVATIVAKLFNIVNPDIAVFGQKDFQQTLVIKQMAADLNMGIKIVIAPTVRENDGLAMSSRNKYLSNEERQAAPALFHSLEEGRKAILQGERRRKIINAIMRKRISEEPKFKTDYLNAADADNLQEPEEFLPGDHIALLGACFMGTTRLIDNALVTVPGRLNENNFIEGI